MKWPVLSIAILCMSTAVFAADVKLASPFTDAVVLRRSKPVEVWGTTDGSISSLIARNQQLISNALSPRGGARVSNRDLSKLTSVNAHRLICSNEQTSLKIDCMDELAIPLLVAGLDPKAKPDAPADWMLGTFTRPEGMNPLITPKADSTFECPQQHKTSHWEAAHTFNPAAIVLDGKVCVLYRAEDDSGANHIGGHTSRLGLAQSEDGLHFTRRTTPVFHPDEDAQKANEIGGGCEDPRLIYGEDGTIVLTYTQWNQKIPRLAIATTRDLLKWEKHGPAFAEASKGKYLNMACKSATILGKFMDDKLTATRIDGKYWMYWGEGDMHFATSADLIHWQPLEDAAGKMRVSLNRRKGKFDSDLAEGGPAAILTERGILVLYNGKNARDGDPSLGVGAYSGGQALFDSADPTRLINRTDTPFYKPELPFEKTGQYGAGTTFLEGLVYFKGKCFLYYGCADSYVGVAVCENPHL